VSQPGPFELGFSLLINAALLLSMVQIIDLALARGRVNWLARPTWVTGLVVGVLGVLLIKVSATLLPGVIFDTRSVLLAISGFFLGPLPTGIAMALTAAYRWTLGGVAMGPGIAVILASGFIGLAWRQALRRPAESIGWRQLYPLGLAVHAVMLALMLLMPREIAGQVLARISLPVMLIHPLITVALGLLLVERLRRRRDRAALQEREERYRSLFHNNHAVMLVIDPDGGAIIDANPAAERYYGWPRERLLAMGIGEINTLDPEAVRAEMERALRRQRHFFEFRHRRADGSIRDVEVFSGPIRIGDRTCLYSIVHDVGERKAAEAALRAMEQQRREEQDLALREQQAARQAALNLMEDAIAARRQAEASLAALQEANQRLELALNAGNQGIFDLDVRTGEAVVSPEYARMLGYDPENFHETNAAWLECLHPEDHDRVARTYRDYIAGAIPQFRVEFRQRMAGGEWIWILSQGKVVERDAEGRPLRMLGTHTDISAQKRLELALRASQGLNQAIVSASPLPILTLDLEGRVQSWNPAAERVFGWSAQEATGRINPMVPADKLDEFAALRRVVGAGGNSWARKRCG
jgi:two-component system sensor histidine kinase/response regulator